MSRKNIMLNYFPHRDACPVDGKPCIKDKCKCWIEEKVCWYIEFGALVEKIFNCDRHDYIRFKDDSKESICTRFFLKPNLYVNEREDFSQPPKMIISIGLDSYRLAEKLKKQFNLTDWEIEDRCMDGGDDHDLSIKIDAPFIERGKVIKILENMKELMPKLIEAEKNINNCELCKEHCESLTEHDKYSICYRCEKKIILENIRKYF